MIHLSVCHIVRPAKTAKAIEMPFGLGWAKGRMLDGGPDPPCKGAILTEGKGRPIVKYRDSPS